MEKGLTIFMPVYNEAGTLPKTLPRLVDFMLAQQGFPWEILIGENGSTDATIKYLYGICQGTPCTNFFSLPARGVGAAFAEAVKRARYDRIITVDADLSMDLGFIPDAYAAMQDSKDGGRKGYDMVVGWKLPAQKRPWYRILASQVYLRLASRMFGLSFQDCSIAGKGYRTEAVRQHLHLIDLHTFYVTRLIYELRDWICYIPVACTDGRPSKFILWREGVYKFWNLFRLWRGTRGQ